MANSTDNGSNTTSPGVVSRRVAPFAPLAIALLAQTALLGGGGTTATPADHGPDTAAVCGDEIPTYQECHSEYPTGCSKAANYDPFLNLLKNQLTAPTVAPLRLLGRDDFGKLEQGLPPALTKSNHEVFKDDLAALGDGRVVGVVGYLYYAKKGGKESSNCQLENPDDIDFHIGIGFDPALAAKLGSKDKKQKVTPEDHTVMNQTSVIVEMTPHWRAQFRPEWKIEALTLAIGHQVRVAGQLLVDNEHFAPHDDCAFPGAGSTCWRASVWELHPVTRFEVCNTSTPCTETSGGWVDLEDFASPGAPSQPASGSPPPASTPGAGS
ncbi:MAG TPA: hypothetical protein VF173_06855 [Thermoanaerobaculia bacterium]|nr:hypothetical protein [Thermoanaerobaculia bacterium]